MAYHSTSFFLLSRTSFFFSRFFLPSLLPLILPRRTYVEFKQSTLNIYIRITRIGILKLKIAGKKEGETNQLQFRVASHKARLWKCRQQKMFRNVSRDFFFFFIKTVSFAPAEWKKLFVWYVMYSIYIYIAFRRKCTRVGMTYRIVSFEKWVKHKCVFVYRLPNSVLRVYYSWIRLEDELYLKYSYIRA